jgi:hypothetical protein
MSVPWSLLEQWLIRELMIVATAMLVNAGLIGRSRRSYLPLNRGLRRSRNASTPSL